MCTCGSAAVVVRELLQQTDVCSSGEQFGLWFGMARDSRAEVRERVQTAMCDEVKQVHSVELT
jgi:hypothetical protein